VILTPIVRAESTPTNNGGGPCTNGAEKMPKRSLPSSQRRAQQGRLGGHTSRYYFHVHIGDVVERDTVGLEFANVNDAIAEAKQVRIVIMMEDGLNKLGLEVVDEIGCIVATVG
jgi:hypothetical protein